MLVMLNSSSLYAKAGSEQHIHRPVAFVEAIKEKENAGELVYQQFCALCHAENPMIKLNAPRINHPKEWGDSLQLSIDEMLANIDEGMGTMPPRGGCFECSDDQLRAAIAYMLPKNYQKS